MLDLNSAVSARDFPQKESLAKRFVEVAFVIFLSMVILGDHPFADRSPQALAQDLLGVNVGDPLREFCYAMLFMFISAITLPALGNRLLDGMALPHILSICWCFLSIIWSVNPELCFRRCVLLVIIVGVVVQTIPYLGIERSLKILYLVLAATILVCWVSLAITSTAVHPPTEDDPKLIGNWRGFFFHKNIAGGVFGLSTLFFLHFLLQYKRTLDAVLFVLSLGFLIGTHSKTSMSFFAVCSIFSLYYRVCLRSFRGRYLFIATFSFVVVSAAILVVGNLDAIERRLADPTIFTGRGEIWQAAWLYIKDHPFLGAGYSSFWLSGDNSPIFQHPISAFLATVPHSHNSYIETLVTCGVVGLFLVVAGFIVVPLMLFLSPDRSNGGEKAMLFGIWLFTILHSFLETDFFARDRQVWVIFLFSITIIQLRRRARSRGALRPLMG